MLVSRTELTLMNPPNAIDLVDMRRYVERALHFVASPRLERTRMILSRPPSALHFCHHIVLPSCYRHPRDEFRGKYAQSFKQCRHASTMNSGKARPEIPSWRHPVYPSGELLHLKSGFQGYASIFPNDPSSTRPSDSLPILLDHLQALNPRIKRATHCMYAWRTGSSTARPGDSQASDGGEAGAGERLIRLLELAGHENVIVVVYRWYGGVKLGNARWKCILGVAKEALAGGCFAKMVEVMKEDKPKSGKGRKR